MEKFLCLIFMSLIFFSCGHLNTINDGLINLLIDSESITTTTSEPIIKQGYSDSIIIKVNNTELKKCELACVITDSTTIEITDDSSWSQYIPTMMNDKPTDEEYKGVFVNGMKITLSPYLIGRYEVTQELFELVMGYNPSDLSNKAAKNEVQKYRPVDSVSWYEAIVFCNKLSKLQGLNPCYSLNSKTDTDFWGEIPKEKNDTWNNMQCDLSKNGYRLPTEAEWEFAARGGDVNAPDWKYAFSGIQTTGMQVYSTEDYLSLDSQLDQVAWYVGNQGSKTHEVGLKKANRLNLYDMSGNVDEFLWDLVGPIVSGTYVNPCGNKGVYNTIGLRVLRGGCRSEKTYFHTVSYRRLSIAPNGKPNVSGFRLARTL